ncbi:ATPase family AAA domain-containing protein At1g05910 isoform X1 [Cynara cardunculus var. scolymus]|uniref:ATPase family AAA domain-containing protein At1g05910 isoform X1 n=2 Tax=Cynara cardunculus var. scolymus TaxID=59895 RepID=UPI000D630D02|nr:ATPase family AAA domain-containing protein At1g05910 isoform X1 [Cynara cardunculus var. scolymus]
MISKQSEKDNEDAGVDADVDAGVVSSPRPVRTSDRLRTRTKSKPYSRYPSLYTKAKRSKTKTRKAASQIAKVFDTNRQNNSDSVMANVRRSTRQRRVSSSLYGYTDSTGSEDTDLMASKYRSSRSRNNSSVRHKEKMPRREGLRPRRDGLRPRRSNAGSRGQLIIESDDELDPYEENNGQENGNEMEDNDADDGESEEGGAEGDGDDEGEGEDEGEEDGDDDDGEEEQEGRRRYDLRNRAEVRRLSLEEGKQRPRSPRRVLQQGVGTKHSRDVRRGGSRVHKRHRISRAEDSDDSLLVDELDQAMPMPWSRGANRSGAPPWLLGGPDMHGTSAWGLNIAASGWGHQGDVLANLASGVQTAGPSSKGGADIQPLQVDESVSFDDIGGLSGYIDALKEMVFFPLLYPDFFASYHITPPRGVLLCGPPGTGKTLIARALACAASKAGQKVSFYMRKGADVLSKWVGEAERQLKMLFEEAQRNQPSIIFFDEIDGLAPVRSSKQEQIHNSIVSTLLALMDGLDSRGQVVLIGATNRIDAIDGALRRPGRFDREFTFPLPGFDARAEILDIHTRKWKRPPLKELKLELAASCVGYCGADLKALCTEAAIRAFREKYPQVYTSDDKFLIDVESVEVDKKHFMEAMSTITPAAHRGSIVHARPLSPVVAPCLQRHLQKAMSVISDIFPALEISSESTKFSMLVCGIALPLVYRPRLLLCGMEGAGLDHLGPAILHELEKFPVHSLGLSSLLSDPSAKTPEEALVHVFGEARRTTPSILYLPQFHLWWENAHEQLRAVLLTLLAELPSDSPILLLGTSSVQLHELDGDPSSVFSSRNVYQVEKPLLEDRSTFFDCLIEAALSIPSEGAAKKSQKSLIVPVLSKAPKVDTGPKVSELKAKAEAEGHALRRLRMCLRDVCNRVLYDKRFSAFHYPVLDEDAPNYHAVIQNPMDMATLLQRVDGGKYITCKAFLEDFDLILANAKIYNRDDYNGARIVSRAYELRDSVQGMLSQMDPALVAFCEKIAEDGGPLSLPEDIAGSSFHHVPIVHMTRASARLRHVQPEVNVDQSYEALKRPKKNVDPSHAAVSTADEGSLPQEPAVDEQNDPKPASSPPGCIEVETPSYEVNEPKSQDAVMSDVENDSKIDSAKKLLLDGTADYGVPQLERLYTRIVKGVFELKIVEHDDHKSPVLNFLLKFAENEANF